MAYVIVTIRVICLFPGWQEALSAIPPYAQDVTGAAHRKASCEGGLELKLMGKRDMMMDASFEKA
jgi:hypothetical protein